MKRAATSGVVDHAGNGRGKHTSHRVSSANGNHAVRMTEVRPRVMRSRSRIDSKSEMATPICVEQIFARPKA
jgi:hypothetical protein